MLQVQQENFMHNGTVAVWISPPDDNGTVLRV
jgi:hypothetical protein